MKFFFPDEGIEQISTAQNFAYSTTNLNDDVNNIHVHHDGGTGGGICAKIIFFILFAILITLFGLIINEHRELSERKHV